ncbi:hypothetical protein ACFFJB_03125 [Camelimonas abortus]|uniref:Uncharacterized protein n=1 Tax=Camelimonas abortus TaxID=1017184 RepID=A0ABV7LHB4_9HYPH
MTLARTSPAAIARRLARRRDQAGAQLGAQVAEEAARAGDQAAQPANLSPWRRESFLLPASEAREAARAWLDRYPRASWRSEIEDWRVVGDNLVQLTLRRLPAAVASGDC